MKYSQSISDKIDNGCMANCVTKIDFQDTTNCSKVVDG